MKRILLFAIVAVLASGFVSNANAQNNSVDQLLQQFEQTVDECTKLKNQLDKTGSISIKNNLQVKLKQAKELKDQLDLNKKTPKQSTRFQRILDKLDKILPGSGQGSSKKPKEATNLNSTKKPSKK